MADVYGVEATKVYNTTPPEVVAGKKFGGVMRRMADSYEASATASGTKIIVGFLPAKSEITRDSAIEHDALNTSVTLALKLRKISDDTEDTVISATAAASAGTITPGIDDVPHEVDGDSLVIIEVGGASADGTIKSEIRYTPQGG